MTVAENLLLARADLPRIIDWRAERHQIEEFMARMPFRLDPDAPARGDLHLVGLGPGAHGRGVGGDLRLPVRLADRAVEELLAVGSEWIGLRILHSRSSMRAVRGRPIRAAREQGVQALMTVNLLHDRCDPSDFARVLIEMEPDVVVTQELGPMCADVLASRYPNHRLRPALGFLGRGIATRFDATFDDIDVTLTGDSREEVLLSGNLLCLLISYHLAILYGVDPGPVQLIEEFKRPSDEERRQLFGS